MKPAYGLFLIVFLLGKVIAFKYINANNKTAKRILKMLGKLYKSIIELNLN